MNKNTTNNHVNSEFMQVITLFTVFYNYVDNAVNLSAVYKEGVQVLGNGLPMPDYSMVCAVLHSQHLTFHNECDFSEENELI